MKTVDTIFLDLDGPLLDGTQRHYSCYRSIMEGAGFVPIDSERYWQLKRDMINRRELLALSRADSLYDEFLTRWLTLIESPGALELDIVQPGALECLRNWRQQGKRLILVTLRKDAAALQMQLQNKGLSAYLDKVLVCAHESGGAGKAQAVLDFLGERPDPLRSVWVGDTEVDAQAARSLGLDVYLVQNGLRSPAILERLDCTRVVESIVTFSTYIE
ncbi:HAD hydrolase-like protein [Pseudomonas protegens]|uniref:HAD family hydrolase n=1 Tax=Pseudomonas protegens TaxID=380021 RepID=UPI002770F63C|nr:HAD family hydrolase [Pseudomonas protegens]MDP9510727.1 HAD hydrolase-like protein [Pseudomonas protegens]